MHYSSIMYERRPHWPDIEPTENHHPALQFVCDLWSFCSIVQVIVWIFCITNLLLLFRLYPFHTGQTPTHTCFRSSAGEDTNGIRPSRRLIIGSTSESHSCSLIYADVAPSMMRVSCKHAPYTLITCSVMCWKYRCTASPIYGPYTAQLG